MSFWKNSISVFLIFVISTWPYSREQSLHAAFAYDDEGTVVQNRVVRPDTPLEELWKVDFWSQELTSAESHKSYRPLTTLTFRWNYARSELDTYEYHVVNVALHGLVTVLIFWALNVSFANDDCPQQRSEPEMPPNKQLEQHSILKATKSAPAGDISEIVESITSIVKQEIKTLHELDNAEVKELPPDPFLKSKSDEFQEDVLQIGSFLTIPFLTSIFFGIHAVHTEAVCNITGRAELLYSAFYILGFIFYFYSLQFKWLVSRWLCLLLCCACTVASVLSKENGISMPGVCAGWHFLYMLLRQNPSAADRREVQSHWLTFFFRFLFLCIFTAAFAFIRLSWNGESPPDFTYKQNPAALNEDRLTRMLSIPWVWCLYLWTLLYPHILSCDWSGDSIPLITSFQIDDLRILAVFSLFFSVFMLVIYVTYKLPSLNHSQYYLALSFLFLFLPFFFSSNILIAIGAMKAERLIYLPSLGFCMLFIYILKKVLSWLRISFTPICVLILAAHFHRLSTRVPDWDDSLNLWEAAYAVNKISLHTKYNYALNLTKHKRWKESHDMLKIIIKNDKHDSASMFLLCLVYINTNKCKKAVSLANKGLKLPQLKEKRNRRTKSNLVTILALCEQDFAKRGKLHYESVEIDPGNNYAVQRAQAYQDLLVKAGILKG